MKYGRIIRLLLHSLLPPHAVKQVKRMQRSETEAIRTQIQPSKPKREITNITNSQNTERMLTVGMMNKQIVRHFQACECTISSLRTKIRKMGSVKIEIMPRKTTRRVTLFRRNRFVSTARMPGFLKNAKGTRICAKAV